MPDVNETKVIRLDRCLSDLMQLHTNVGSLARAVRRELVGPSERFFSQLCADNGCTMEQWADSLAHHATVHRDFYRQCTGAFSEVEEQSLRRGLANAVQVTGRKCPISIHVFTGLFQCTAVAYDWDVGFALETFMPLAIVRAHGLPDSSLRMCQGCLSDIPVLAAHEYTHACHADFDDNSLAAKAVTEGIAIVTSMASVPDCDLALHLSMTNTDVKWCSAYETRLLAQFSADMYRTDRQTKAAYFASVDSVPVPGAPARVGYYLGFRICQEYLRRSGHGIPTLLDERDSRAIINRSGLI